MRLPIEDIPHIPAAAALVDRAGTVMAKTPEWRGPGPATLSYRYGQARLLVGSPDADPNTDAVITELLGAVSSAASRLAPDRARMAQLLSAGLAAACGRPITTSGNMADVAAFIRVGTLARCRAPVTLVGAFGDAVSIEGPEAMALALVQLAKNLEEHQHAEQVTITASHGPTFTLSSTSSSSGPRNQAVRTSRAASLRPRWGAAYVTHIADALGGSISPPRYPRDGVCEISLGFGTSRLALPLAVTDGRVILNATPAWVDETGLSRQAPLPERLQGQVLKAQSTPGAIVSLYPFDARAVGNTVWLAELTNRDTDVAREVVNGLAHERALWYGCEPEKTQVYALSWILARRLGARWPSENNLRFHPAFAEACERLGVPAVSLHLDSLTLPDPSITAYLLSRLGGRVVERSDSVYLEVPAQTQSHHLARLLGGRAGEEIPLLGA